MTNIKLKNKNIIGFDLNNLFDNKKTPSLSFIIKDIEVLDNNEILKLLFFNGLVVRIMKFKKHNNKACATFDIVDDEKKVILLKTDKVFIGGLGIAEIFYKMNYITQWEIPIMIMLCRGFVFGDVDVIKNLIKNYYLKISKENEWRLKDKIGFY